MKTVHGTASEALDGLLHDGMLIAAGGFGLGGIPELLVGALVESGVKDLAVASNNAGVGDFGPGRLLATARFFKDCTLPLTGKGVVDRITTNPGVLDVTHKGLHIVECVEGVSGEDIIKATEATIV